MSLFDKIAKWGYEVEYPLVCLKEHEDHDEEGLNYLRMNESAAFDRWALHYDGCGVEFTVVTPQPSFTSMVREITAIYDYIDDLINMTGFATDVDDDMGYDERKAAESDTRFTTNDDLFNSNQAGVHIRIDVTNWTTVERLCFMRLFSDEFENTNGRCFNYYNYISWMAEEVFGRDWNNWNEPFNYLEHWTKINSDQSTPSKSYNVQYEHDYLRTGRNTIEIRGFGVHPDLKSALNQLGSVKTLCEIVDRSFLFNGKNPVIDKLFVSWDTLVNLKLNDEQAIAHWDNLSTEGDE